MNRIILLKSLDKLLGAPLVNLLSKMRAPRRSAAGVSRRILLIRPGGIGDAVLLLPAINSLKSQFPDYDIDVLSEKRNAEIFCLSKEVSRVYLYDKGFELLNCLKNTYDVVIDTEQWHRLSAVIAYLTGARVRIGFDTNERGKLFTHKMPYHHEDYEVYSFLHLIELLIGKDLPFVPDEPFIDTSSVSLSPSILQEISDGAQLVAIFPGASVYERRWGGDKFGGVTKELRRKGFRILILGSEADHPDAKNIKEIAGDSIDLTGRTSLIDVAAILKKCKLLITADSGLMHLAYAGGTPTVSLFGSGIEKKWAPPGKFHIALNKHLTCSPCTKFGYTPRCRKKAECLSLIGVDEVLYAACQLLRQKA